MTRTTYKNSKKAYTFWLDKLTADKFRRYCQLKDKKFGPAIEFLMSEYLKKYGKKEKFREDILP